MRFHGVPRRDVPRRVHVGVAGVAAGRAQEESLALATLAVHVPTRRAALARIRGTNSLDSPGSLLLDSPDQQAPSGTMDATVQSSLLADVASGSFGGSFCRADHRPHVQVLKANHVEAASESRACLLAPVPSSVGIERLHMRDSGLDLLTSIRATSGFGQLPLQSQQPSPLTWLKAWTVQHLARRKCCRYCDAPVNADDRPGPRARNRHGGRSERNMPSARTVTGDPKRPYAFRNRPGPTEPHPARFRDVHLGPVPVQAPHIGRSNVHNPETLVATRLPPRRPAVRAVEIASHGLVVIADCLLLDNRAALCQPRIVRTGFGQLAASLYKARHPASATTPTRSLLNAEVPYVAGVGAMPEQRGFLPACRLKAVPERHTNILAIHDTMSESMYEVQPCLKGSSDLYLPNHRSLRWRGR
jgi:hypothetical protein